MATGTRGSAAADPQRAEQRQPAETPPRSRPAPPLENLTDPSNAQAQALVAFWRAHHGADGALPDRRTFQPAHLRPWLGCLSIYRAVDDRSDFRITLDGTEIVEMTGEDWTGRRTSEVDRIYGTDLTGLMRVILDIGEPCIQRISLVQKQWASATRISMPVSHTPGEPADEIFMAIFLD